MLHGDHGHAWLEAVGCQRGSEAAIAWPTRANSASAAQSGDNIPAKSRFIDEIFLAAESDCRTYSPGASADVYHPGPRRFSRGAVGQHVRALKERWRVARGELAADDHLHRAAPEPARDDEHRGLMPLGAPVYAVAALVALSDLYRAARLSIHQAGRTRALLHAHEQGQVLEVDAMVARLLSLCQGCKTLEGHAAAIARTGLAGDVHAVTVTLQSLAMSGLLRNCGDLWPASALSAAAEVAPVTTVAIITADRPAVLRRGVESFARHFDEHDQRARLLVVDGSRDATHQAANRQVAADLARSGGRTIDYAGVDEARALRVRLAAAGASETMLDFALTPGAIGANRNLVVILTAGEHVLMADDDIVCEPWRRDGGSQGIAVWGHTDPQDSEFFASREDARHAAARARVDLLAAHAALLGQPMPDLLASTAGEPDLGETCSHLIGALAEGRQPAVRLTFTGMAGDSGTYCPYSRLFASGPTQAKMAAGRDVFERALRSREVLRIASRATLTHDPRCMAGCMGLANRAGVPPFMPVGRNEDGVFGAMLHALDPLALFAHVPVGVVHDSSRPAVYEDRSMRSASETRVSELLILLARAAMQGALDTHPAVRLARLSGTLAELGRLDAGAFARHVTRVMLDSRAQQLGRIEAMVSRTAEYPPYWRSSLEEYRRTLVRSVARPDFFLPIEFQDAEGVEAGFRRLQEFVGGFGALLVTWPEIWTKAMASR